jgi:hypothetical protein
MLLIRYIAYFIGVALVVFLLARLEISFPGSLQLDSIGNASDVASARKFSPIGIVQSLLLVICGLLQWWVALHCHSQRPIAILFSGLALIFLLHELDDFLDNHVIVNLWQVMIAIVAALIIVYCYRQWRRLRIAWFRVWPSPGLTLYFAGAIVVLILVPVFAQETLWKSPAGDLERMVSATAKEFAELIGYALWLIGTVEYAMQARIITKHEPQSVAAKRRAGRHPKSEGRY